MSQVFNTFLSVNKSPALKTHIQMVGEGEQGLAEFACVRPRSSVVACSMVEIMAMGLP